MSSIPSSNLSPVNRGQITPPPPPKSKVSTDALLPQQKETFTGVFGALLDEIKGPTVLPTGYLSSRRPDDNRSLGTA